MSFVLYFLIIAAAISLCIVVFLIISAGDLTKFKAIHRARGKESILPIISRYGDLITTPQELDFHLSNLKTRLRDKFQELESFKSKVHNRLENLQKFDHFKKACMEMQANLIKTEEEVKDLQQKIEYFKKIQVRVQEDVAPGATFMGDADWMIGTSMVAL
ncbi:hypothetical protein Zmor_023417 [Zophobas morio]|uniref:Uncharacterized protein n=1 Tax=Zophobas morio TaxID=2755281 RepID=A0AA38M6E8_9CUCU|nr:hypothetical protein Zmor_023417 [Zophobas morio]